MKTQFSTKISTAAAIGALLIALPLTAARADDATPAVTGTVLELSADAQVSAAPDIATISAGVTTQADTAAAALKDNAQKMSAVFDTLKKLKIADKDIQTASVSVNPQYTYSNNSMGEQHPPRISGYQATNTVTVTLRGGMLGNIGPVLDALATAGANNLNGPTFSIENKDDLLDKARTMAVDKAQKRAELYATATGLHVKRIISLSEAVENNFVPPRPMMLKAMATNAAPATQVAPGEVDVSINLDVQYELSK